MHLKQKLWTTVILLTSFLQLTLNAADTNIFLEPDYGIPLTIALQTQNHYRSAHPIVVKVMLTNSAQEPLLINSRMRFNHYRLDGELTFLIEGPDQKVYPFTRFVTPRDISDKDLSILNAGDTIDVIADLTDMYNLRKRGTYKVQVIYHNAIDLQKDGLRTWSGKVVSEPTEIVIE